MRAILLALAFACGAVLRIGATSYPSITFDELVKDADVIFVGEVIDVRPFPVNTRDGPIVKTRILFRVSDPIYGTAAALEVFEFLGGEWGDVRLTVADMPSFSVGDRRVVFARRERSINPIVGFTQGLLKVTRDSAGVDRVVTLDGFPVAGPDTIGAARQGAAREALPMRLVDLRNQIVRTVAAARKQ